MRIVGRVETLKKAKELNPWIVVVPLAMFLPLKSFLFLHLCQNLIEGGAQVHHQVGRDHCLHVQVPSQPKGSQ